MGANKMVTTFKEHIQPAIKTLVAVIISITAVVCALLVSVQVFDLTKGKNYSDVGIPMYTHSGRACLLSVFNYITIIGGVFFLVKYIWGWRWFTYIYGVVNFLGGVLVLIPVMFVFT
jgi:uncharacterized protein with PQ loop repeat